MCAFVRHHGDLYCLVTAVSQSILYPLFLPYDSETAESHSTETESLEYFELPFA